MTKFPVNPKNPIFVQENLQKDRRAKGQKERMTEGWSDLNSQDHLKDKKLKRIMQQESKKACNCHHMKMD